MFNRILRVSFSVHIFIQKCWLQLDCTTPGPSTDIKSAFRELHPQEGSTNTNGDSAMSCWLSPPSHGNSMDKAWSFKLFPCHCPKIRPRCSATPIATSGTRSFDPEQQESLGRFGDVWMLGWTWKCFAAVQPSAQKLWSCYNTDVVLGKELNFSTIVKLSNIVMHLAGLPVQLSRKTANSTPMKSHEEAKIGQTNLRCCHSFPPQKHKHIWYEMTWILRFPFGRLWYDDMDIWRLFKMSSPESGRNSHLQWAPPLNVYIFVYPWNRRMKTCFAQNRGTVTSAESFFMSNYCLRMMMMMVMMMMMMMTCIFNWLLMLKIGGMFGSSMWVWVLVWGPDLARI